MKTIKILHMYADMLDLYGDSGNMEVMAFRCKKRGIECQIDKYSIDSEMPDFKPFWNFRAKKKFLYPINIASPKEKNRYFSFTAVS